MVRTAWKAYEQPYRLFELDVELAWEMADHYEVKAVPTLVLDQLGSEQRYHLIGECSASEVLNFARNPRMIVCGKSEKRRRSIQR